MNKLRIRYPKNVIVSHINVNSVRNKIHNLENLIKTNTDILTISETKLDSSFPLKQFGLRGFKSPYRLDINSRSGGLLVYVNEDIPSRRLNQLKIPSDIQLIPIEINLKKQKWLLLSIYRPQWCKENYFLAQLSLVIDHYTKYIPNLIINGDFNLQPTDKKCRNL